MTFRIGNVTLENRTVLAPMAGITDSSFRLLCREMGAGLLYTEMISAKAILHGNKKTEQLLDISEAERPIALQLFGAEADVISEAAARIEERPFDILDINMGCPVPKVVGNGEGAALMKNPRLVGEIIEKTVRAIKKPVSVKIRKGFSADNVNAVEIARVAAQSGASAVAVHGRTRDQFYAGVADWEIIAAVKDSVSIPVIGNGDVKDAASAALMMEKTGCDAVMVGRAARGNPWLFQDIFAELALKIKSTDTPVSSNPRPSPAEITNMIHRHTALMIEHKGEYIALREMRKHIGWYTAGFPHSASLRRKICTIETWAELEALLAIW